MSQKVPQGTRLYPFEKRSRIQVMEMLQRDPWIWDRFLALTEELKEELILFSMGNSGLKISYDPFFKMLFDPEIHQERLSRMLSCIIDQKVTVKRALPNASNRVTAEGSLLIMDILAELENGELVNVEIQKIGYAFPGERAACYSSDLMLRQYSRVKSLKKQRFSYQDLKSVYTIVLIEKSGAEFHELSGHYIHRAQQRFDTGLAVNLLQKYIFISLDVFLKMAYTLEEETEAWLLFLSSDQPEDIIRILEKYPSFRELYEETAKFQTKPEELVGMYSKALEILDKNTVQYMIEEQKKEIEEQKKEIEKNKLELSKSRTELDKNRTELDKSRTELDKSRTELNKSKTELEKQQQELRQKDDEIRRLKALISGSDLSE